MQIFNIRKEMWETIEDEMKPNRELLNSMIDEDLKTEKRLLDKTVWRNTNRGTALCKSAFMKSAMTMNSTGQRSPLN